MSSSRWRTVKNMSISGSRPKFQPKPSPPQRGRREHNIAFKQGPNNNTGSATMAQVRNIQPISAQAQSSCFSSKPGTSDNTVQAAETTSVPIIVQKEVANNSLRLPSTAGRSPSAGEAWSSEASSRSGSAPCSSPTVLVAPLGTTCLPSCQPADEKSSLLGGDRIINTGCPTSESVGRCANMTRHCWDEQRDNAGATPPVNAATPPPRYGGATTMGNEAATSTTVSEGQQKEPLLQGSDPNSSSTRRGGLNGPRSSSG